MGSTTFPHSESMTSFAGARYPGGFLQVLTNSSSGIKKGLRKLKCTEVYAIRICLYINIYAAFFIFVLRSCSCMF